MENDVSEALRREISELKAQNEALKEIIELKTQNAALKAQALMESTKIRNREKTKSKKIKAKCEQRPKILFTAFESNKRRH